VDPAGSWRPVAHGRDFYAAVTFSDAPQNRRIALGWAGNWQYASETPTGEWRGVMSSPRELGLVTTPDGFALVQRLPPHLEALQASAGVRELPIVAATPSTTVTGRRYALAVDWRPEPDATLRLEVLAGSQGGVAIAYDARTGRLSLDRRRSGIVDLHPDFASTSQTSVPLRDGRLTMSVIVDECIVEIFADDGAVTFTDLVFPLGDADLLTVSADAGSGTIVVSPLS
jgi:fructan beta-fructosidase